MSRPIPTLHAGCWLAIASAFCFLAGIFTESGVNVLDAPGAVAAEPRPPGVVPPGVPTGAFPTGKWNVAFTNGVIEACDIFEFDGLHITVDEPARRARGIVTVEGGSFVMRFHDDRVERWTAIGDRYVVEHFFPGGAFPSGRPVLGIAERAR